MRRMKVAALAVSLMAFAPVGHTETPLTRVRGTIASIDGDKLLVTPNGGSAPTLVTLDAKVKISALVPTTMSSIKPGSYIGTAAETQPDGTLVAKEVHVFPEAMRGSGEGHVAFDLGPKSSMTNGTVGNEVVGTSGNTLTVKYKGGETPIVVPPNVPVVTFEPGERAELTPGAHVIVFAQTGADGGLTSSRVVVGKDGLTPPM